MLRMNSKIALFNILKTILSFKLQMSNAYILNGNYILNGKIIMSILHALYYCIFRLKILITFGKNTEIEYFSGQDFKKSRKFL